MTQGDIHNISQTLQRQKTSIRNHSQISERDKKILIEGNSNFPSFLTFMRNKDHSKTRINRYLQDWKKISAYTSWNIEDVNKPRMAELIGELNTGELCKKNGEPYAPESKREIKKSVRKMYTDYLEVYREELKVEDDFRGDDIINYTLTRETNYTDPDRLPLPETVKALVENAPRVIDKAYIMLLWSTGGRHGEILGLKWRDVDFSSKIGKVIFRDTKTGGDHSVPMAEALPFMRELLEKDPRSDEPNTYVFRSSHTDEQYSANGAAEILSRAREKTDIPRKIKTNPHAFRKGRTVYWIRQGKNEAWICKHMNWVPGSPVVAYYARVAKEDVEHGVAEHLNLQEVDNTERESKVLTPAECHQCEEINSFQADVCRKCGEALRTGNLIEKSMVNDTKGELKTTMIEKEIGIDDRELEKEAERLVKEKLGKV
jgi:integrase/ribosomal protein L40E